MTFNWTLWAKGLLAAAIGGATTSVTSALADPTLLSKNPKGLLTMGGAGALLGGLSYLKTHPPIDVADEQAKP